MKRIPLCIFALTMLSVICLGQETNTNWQRFSPPTDEFAVDTPIQLKQVGNNDLKSSRKFYGSIDGAYLYVFSDPVESKYYFSVIKDYLSYWGQETKDLDSDTKESSSLSFKDKFGFWQHVIFVRTETRIYVAQALSDKDSHEVVTRFITSFGLGEKRFVNAFDQDAGGVVKNTKPRSPPGNDSGFGQGSGSGTGSGVGTGSGSASGSGSGSGISTRPTQQPSPKQATPIKLLSKPRVPYTDIARVYEISGTVILRISFLASGEIGAVTPIQKLPFGLTESAIDAAKKIKFEPAQLDGKPITVVKQLEFSFSIY